MEKFSTRIPWNEVSLEHIYGLIEAGELVRGKQAMQDCA
jgi:hypothetical protein